MGSTIHTPTGAFEKRSETPLDIGDDVVSGGIYRAVEENCVLGRRWMVYRGQTQIMECDTKWDALYFINMFLEHDERSR